MAQFIKYIKFRWKIKAFMFALLLGVSTISIHFSSIEYAGLLAAKGSFGLSFFYDCLSLQQTLYIYSMLILIIPNVFASDVLRMRNNGCTNAIISRMGYASYFKNNVFITFVFSFLVILLFQIFVLLLIHFVYAPIEFTNFTLSNMVYSPGQFLHPNEIINLVLFILCTSVGYGIFSVFLYSLQVWIRNVYLFSIMGFITGLLFSTGNVLIGKSIYMVFPNAIVEHIAAGAFIGNLINPGAPSSNVVFGEVPSLWAFGISCMLYGAISLLLLRKLYKKEYLYG